MEPTTSFANVFLWIAMFLAIGYAVIYMAIIAHGILQDPDKRTYSKLKNKLRMPLRRKNTSSDPLSEPRDIKGFVTKIKAGSFKNKSHSGTYPLPR